MDRSDLLTPEAKSVVRRINDLIEEVYSRGLHMTSWYGTLPDFLESEKGVGIANRGRDYTQLLEMADDRRLPWYLYWEIFWVLIHGPSLKAGDRVLDAGGTSSLFSCYLASLGIEVHSIDLNGRLVANGNTLTKNMKWNMHSYHMDMSHLDFSDGFFDHAYSICVFEHLDNKTKILSLEEIARSLKPGGVLSITFDYRNPAPNVFGYGSDTRTENQLKTREDLERVFLSTKYFEIMGNREFHDNGQSYLVHPRLGNHPYTFGAIFLRKKDLPGPTGK